MATGSHIHRLKMVKMSEIRKWILFLCCLGLTANVLFKPADCSHDQNPLISTPSVPLDSREASVDTINVINPLDSAPGVSVHVERRHNQVVMDNGILRMTLSNPDGDIIGIAYNGVDNVLEVHNPLYNRGYFDIVWNYPNTQAKANVIRAQGTKYSVVTSNENQVEISFSSTWSNDSSSIPLNIDRRYIMLRGSSGFYTYTILERLEDCPAVNLGQIRYAFKLRGSMFHYMALSKERQRVMPTQDDRKYGQTLAYGEAVRLTNPANPYLKGEVDDKYQYSCENKDNKVHGWTTLGMNPSIGFWLITPSEEFRMFGPLKQELTSHVGPTTLGMLVSAHYSGKGSSMNFEDGEPWKKVYGPFFVYLNSNRNMTDVRSLFDDAEKQMRKEEKKWPYDFPKSKDYLQADQRGSVAGRLFINDSFISEKLIKAKGAYVGLALPGDVGSWQKENKGYQFWTRTNKKGFFTLNNIRPGNYSLYAWVPGFIGDYKYETLITINPGSNVLLNSLAYKPPRNGPTIWEIGIPDRSAAEFYVPDPYPTLVNKLYLGNSSQKFRQYGLWDRYTDLYPQQDLQYTIGSSDYRRDWFYAHLNRKTGNRTYTPTIWQIKFKLDLYQRNVRSLGNYTLHIALAAANEADLQVRINYYMRRPIFHTGLIGRDNAIARHGIHGLYWRYSITIPSYLLINGNNTIYLTQNRGQTPFEGVMYDYLRLEGPSTM